MTQDEIKSMTFRMPELSEWRCELFGPSNGIVYKPPKGQEPNWFWRKMQYLCFGHRWVKGTTK